MGSRRWRRLSEVLRRTIIRRAAQGATYGEIIAELDVTSGTVSRVVVPLGGVMRRDDWEPSESGLSAEDRVEILVGIERDESLRSIARRLGRAPSTVCREVNTNGGRDRYKPLAAHQRARERARRPKATKLESNPRLCERVVADLKKLWSPEQIAKRLRRDFGDDESMTISHETIYKSIYVQSRGELRRELARCLRTGRATRRRRGRSETRGRIPAMVMISERPAEVQDRAVPGHWEGDLVIGKAGASAVGTLVERSTRYVQLLHLPHGRSAAQVRDALTAAVTELPESLQRSLTWDQGAEMAEHVSFSIDTGIEVYFCDPHAPWQRGSNENTNGLLRQYMPKGTDLSGLTRADLQAIADSLNGRPRKTLDWMTPLEKLAELVATTD